MVFHIGCSGFHYKHWKGIFYPNDLPKKNWFEYYCRFFNTLELNVTFYRFPRLLVLEKWHQESPENFQFSVKAPRVITHFKKLHDSAAMVEDFYKTVDQGLKEKIGCILFQFPPNFIFSQARLEQIIISLNPTYKNVVEFRHLSWWQKDVYDALGKHHIGYCGMDHPEFPGNVIGNTAHVYHRMHGATQLYSSNYSEEELDHLYKEIIAMPDVKQAYVYFNNDAQGYAIGNAQYLKKKVYADSA